jgi:hypothetical protein
MVEDTGSQSCTIWKRISLESRETFVLILTVRISAFAKFIDDQQAPVGGQIQRHRYLLQVDHECALVLVLVSVHHCWLTVSRLTLDTLSRVATRVMILSVRPMSALVAGTKLPT